MLILCKQKSRPNLSWGGFLRLSKNYDTQFRNRVAGEE